MSHRMTVLALAGCALAPFVLAFPAAAPARAQRVSPMQAGRFVQFCNSPRNGGQQICDAYITGMADSFALMQKLGADQGKSGICVPRSASGATMRGMVVSWIDGHRDRLRDQVGEVVYTALHDSFPCDGAKPGGPG